jgi:hypothetical protein
LFPSVQIFFAAFREAVRDKRQNALAARLFFEVFACPRDHCVVFSLGIWFYGFMKTTLELPDDLFREMKAAAALRGMKLRDFVTSAISEQLARMKKQNSSWSRRLPPAPRVSKTELKRIHRLIEEDSERIDTEDWRR